MSLGRRLVSSGTLPETLWLAHLEGARPRLNVLRRRMEAVGYRCQMAELVVSGAAPYAQVQQCQLEAPLHSDHR